ncbi:MAG: SIS domain-containing protein, partial [Clostridia bacterium]|nr:SIS domain-containing protein [Clostridia bacterium]
TCGNGGSAADADHIVGELAKGFLKKRPLPGELRDALAVYPEGSTLADGLQGGLPAVSLHSQSALLTAFANDCDPALIYAQALYALARPGDMLLAISTSGNSQNVVNAAKLAKARGVTLLALTGERPSKLSDLADCIVRVGDTETYRVQELHLPVYHWLCAGVEETFFAD